MTEPKPHLAEDELARLQEENEQLKAKITFHGWLVSLPRDASAGSY